LFFFFFLKFCSNFASILRDIPMSPTATNNQPRKHTYETIGNVDFSECDIFRVERLWKDKTGKRFVFGHHYLRPHETFHEPTRKFYPNEVLRVPLYEVVQIELIIDRCWVLDPQTFCKGRPLAASEPHVYICELRVDKSASAFSKISQKHAYQVCTQSYAFHKFEQKLKIYRTYAVSLVWQIDWRRMRELILRFTIHSLTIWGRFRCPRRRRSENRKRMRRLVRRRCQRR
jgi:BAH domain